MGGAAAASMNTFRALSYCCAGPLVSKSVLSRFSSGGLRGGHELGFCYGGAKKCKWWVLVDKRKKQISTLNWTRRQPACAVETSSSGGSSDGTGRKVFRMPVLDRDENGNIYIREFPGDESFASSESSSPSSSRTSRPAGKSNASRETKSIREAKTVSRKSPSSKPLSTVKVNLPTLDPRARRLASAKVATKRAPLYSKAARRFYNEKFRAEPQRLSKVLAAAGGQGSQLVLRRVFLPEVERASLKNPVNPFLPSLIASRRGCEEVIFDGRVTVNGSVCKVPQTPVDPLKDIIYVDGNSLPKKMPPKIYFALNKPKGYICSAGEEGTKPILSLFEEYLKVWAQRNPGLAKPRMFTVGRLDVATSGLLLVTNDGDFAQKVSHPSSGLTKEYFVTVNERVTKRQLQTVANGTMVQGVQCVPQEVEPVVLEPGDEHQRLRIVVNEGRNHEVRHLVENAGLQVLALKRTRIGGLRLSRKLGIGKFDTLTEMQVAKVLNKNVQSAI